MEIRILPFIRIPDQAPVKTIISTVLPIPAPLITTALHPCGLLPQTSAAEAVAAAVECAVVADPGRAGNPLER